MNKTEFDKIIDLWAKSYFTEPLWLCCIVIALLTGIKFFKREIMHKMMLGYCIMALLIIPGALLIVGIINIKGKEQVILIESVNMLFTITESLIFYSYYTKLLKTRFLTKILKLCLLIIFISSIFFSFLTMHPESTAPAIKKLSFQVNAFEFFFLLIPCLVYFYRLLAIDNPQPQFLLKRPSYWITIGLFFYLIISLPLLLIGDLLSTSYRNLYYTMFSIHHISLCILFLCLAKAFSCKTLLTT